MEDHRITASSPTGNLMLDSFSRDVRTAITRAAQASEFEAREVLFRSGEIPDSLTFLISGVASSVVPLGGKSAEVGMVGREGLIGFQFLFGSKTAGADCVVQISGSGLLVPRKHLLSIFRSSTEFRNRVLDQCQQQMLIATQTAACNALHDAQQRIAKWLLMASFLSCSNNLPVEQERIARLLGLRRTTVSLAIAPLRRRGALKMGRANILITDRALLRDLTCECYEVSRQILRTEAMRERDADR